MLAVMLLTAVCPSSGQKIVKLHHLIDSVLLARYSDIDYSNQ